MTIYLLLCCILWVLRTTLDNRATVLMLRYQLLRLMAVGGLNFRRRTCTYAHASHAVLFHAGIHQIRIVSTPEVLLVSKGPVFEI